MNNKETPVRYRYHLSLSRRRGFNLTPQQYHELKTVGLIVDLHERTLKEGEFKVLHCETSLNLQLFKICTAINFQLDDFGTSEIVIKILKEFQHYASPEVARALRSWLGAMIKNRAMAN